jgi:O-methyltransferase
MFGLSTWILKKAQAWRNKCQKKRVPASIMVNSEEYDVSRIAVLKHNLSELQSYRVRDTSGLMTLFNAIHTPIFEVDYNIRYRLSRLAGTTLLEAAFILRALEQTKNLDGDWCEYGVAHGRTSALLAQVMMQQRRPRTLWLNDSFEGLPEPHEKDVLLHDIFSKGSMAAYKGAISFPEAYVIDELHSVKQGSDWYRINKGWITAKSLAVNSPSRISFAFLDMDFYKSTYDVLRLLIEKMPTGGVAILDDYGFFSEGVKTAAQEILAEFPKSFDLEVPYSSKFAMLTRI